MVASFLPGEQLCAFWTTCVCFATTCSRQHWQGSPEFSCTKGRRGLGTEQVSDNIDQLGPEVWHANRHRRELWAAIRQCQICSVLGSFCSKAQILGRTTPRAPCSPVFQLRIATRTTRACGTLPKPCWMESLKQIWQKASSCQHSLPIGLWSARCAPVVYWGRCFAQDQPAHTRCGPRRAD